MKGKLVKAQGVTATAHKLARLMYALIQNGQAYDEQIVFLLKPENHQKQLRQIEEQAQT